MKYTVRDMIELLSKYPGDAKLSVEINAYPHFYELRDITTVSAVVKDESVDANKVGIKTDVKELIFS